MVAEHQPVAGAESASRHDTKAALLLKSRRRKGEAPIRRLFVQSGYPDNPSPGPLADLVSSHSERALDGYLLLLALASGPPHNIRVDGRIGLRPIGAAIGLPRNRTGGIAISKALSNLEDRRLVSRVRDSEGSRVIRLNREDGSGEAYVHPFRSHPREPYFKLPFSYWLDDYDERLSLASKAVLLIGLSLKPWFILPAAQVARWYGISADTLQRGLDGLEREELVLKRKEFKRAPLAPRGYTEQWRYRLISPFARSTTLATDQQPVEIADPAPVVPS